MKCPVYGGTPLLWTPWGPGEVSSKRGFLISGVKVSLLPGCPLRRVQRNNNYL